MKIKGVLIGTILVISCIIGITFIKATSKEVDEFNEIVETDNYTMKISYPIINNGKIDKLIKEYIDSKRCEFLKIITSVENIRVNYDFKINYQKEILSNVTLIYFKIFSNTGGNNYNKEYKTIIYDDNFAIKDITYFLKDNMFNKFSSLVYQKILDSYSLEELLLTKVKLKSFLNDSSNYERIYFEDSLKLYFSFPKEIVIDISYQELKTLFKDDYLKLDENASLIYEKPEKRDLSKFKDKKLIAFTFDDGPSGITMTKLLDNLDKYDARVSFFVLGSRVETFKDNLKRAYLMGNTIGNHTFNHLNFYRLKDDEQIEEITKTNEVIESLIGFTPRFLRPPYGNIKSKIKEESNMYTILWSIDSLDWKTKNAKKIAQKIVDNAKDGAIILLHDIYMTSVNGAILAMEQLKSEGYAFVSLDEMIELKNIRLNSLKTYHSF